MTHSNLPNPDPGYFELAFALFRGRLGWVTWVIVIVQAMIFAGGVYCAVQFYAATDVVMAVKWGISGGVLIILATALKLSLMPGLQAERLLRRIAHLEAALADR